MLEDWQRIHSDINRTERRIRTCRRCTTPPWHEADTGEPSTEQEISGRPSPLLPLKGGGVIAGDELILGTAVDTMSVALDASELCWWHDDRRPAALVLEQPTAYGKLGDNAEGPRAPESQAFRASVT